MRLMTWNIQWALGADGIMDPARIAAYARAVPDLDVLCLQEVADNCPELAQAPGHDQFALIAAEMPGFDAVAGPVHEWRDAAGRPKRFGNMILSRLPVTHVLRHTLPWEAEPTRNMPRGLIEVTVAAPAGPLRIMTTHLEYSHPRLRQAQVEAIREIHRMACDRVSMPREDGPGTYVRLPGARSAILTGDFNMKPGDPTLARLTEDFEGTRPAFRDAWQIVKGDLPHPPSACIVDQSFAPPHCCDYVFVTEDLASRVTAVDYDVETRISDHQPVLVDIGNPPSP